MEVIIEAFATMALFIGLGCLLEWIVFGNLKGGG